jgi:high affinity Mn2+ porin
MKSTLHRAARQRRGHRGRFDGFPQRALALLACSWAAFSGAAEAPDTAGKSPGDSPDQAWNWHAQNTDILQYHPGFAAKYAGPNSLNDFNEAKETVSLDVLFGVRLWRGAEFHADGLMWQGFGLSDAVGIDGFPNGEAFRLGTKDPNVDFARLFIRQTIGLGGEEEKVEDDALHLAGKQDASRLTLTVGKLSVKDIFDNNAYANDPRSQFMNWALMANEAWDFPADSLGYITGFAAELYEPQWALRYGFFQVPRTANHMAEDFHFFEAWGMVTELERRFAVNGHPGAVRLLAFLNEAHMGSYEAAIAGPHPADIFATRAYRLKYGFGLNVEQELIKNVGAFMRAGWSDGQNEAWAFSDVDRAASLGLSVKGAGWRRPDDTVGLAGIANGLSRIHQEFFAAGGTGILAGDGALNYGWEKILETYYDFQLYKALHGTLDYQFVANPAFNRDRGPVAILGARLHWEF